MVNLQQDPHPEQKIVKAAMVDKKAIDQAIQRQAAEEQKKRDDLLAQQHKVEQLQMEAIKAKQELELANAQKAQVEAAAKRAAQQKAKLEQQQLQAKKELEKQQLAKQQLAKQQLAQQQQLAKQQAEAAAKQAAAIKAQQDRLVAEHQEFLLTEVEKYRAAFQAAVEDNRILSSVFTGNISCKIRIRLLPDGSILSVNIIETSGNPAYDEMSAAAVYKSAPFPMPQDHELYNQLRDIVLSFKNGEQASDVL